MSKDVRKTVSNYETVLRTECEGHTEAVQLRPALIVVVQRSKGRNEVGEKGGERVAVVVLYRRSRRRAINDSGATKIEAIWDERENTV